MNRDNQIKMTKKMQDKFNQFFKPFADILTKPQYKALLDMSHGILGSGTLLLNQMAKQLSEPISIKKITERFHRHLSHSGLHELIRQRHMQRQCHHFDQDTLIIIDSSDITKPEAKKMEGLQVVRDGSTGTHSGLGYDLLNIVACREQEMGYRLLPLSTDILSHTVSGDSLSNLECDRIDEITLYSHNKGIFMFDRGYDKRNLLAHLVSNENAFIIRGMGRRYFMTEETEISFAAMSERIERKYRFPGLKPDRYFEAGIKRVHLRTSPHPKKKHVSSVEVWLVVARYKYKKQSKKGERRKEGFFHFLCDFPHQALTEEDIINKVLSNYRKRWKVEEVHRQLKQDYGWEKMQVMGYESIQNLNMIFWIAISLLYSCKDHILQWAEAFPKEFERFLKKPNTLYDFVYYALKQAVICVFRSWSKYKHNRMNYEKDQLWFAF